MNWTSLTDLACQRQSEIDRRAELRRQLRAAEDESCSDELSSELRGRVVRRSIRSWLARRTA